MKLQDYGPDFNNLITISQVLDKRGTKQTSLILDTTNNKFYVIDDDNNAYPLNPSDPEWSQTIIQLLNQIIQSNNDCPECLNLQLEWIRESLTTILNSDTNSLINSSKNELIEYLNNILDKVKNETIIVKEVQVEKIKEIIKEVKVPYIQYVEVRTTKYVPSCKKRPDKTETLPPTNIPPSSIPGWIYNHIEGYYYKYKRGIKYIKINNNVWREDEYEKLYKTTKERSHWHFGKTQ